MDLTLISKYPFLNDSKKYVKENNLSVLELLNNPLYERARVIGIERLDKAKEARKWMKDCPRACGWYQYFATDSFASPRSIISSLSPYLFK